MCVCVCVCVLKIKSVFKVSTCFLYQEPFAQYKLEILMFFILQMKNEITVITRSNKKLVYYNYKIVNTKINQVKV